jgi:four helix bundle protein
MEEHVMSGDLGKRDIVERTFAFAVAVVRLCQNSERSTTSRAMVNQLLGAATSVGANVEEAQAGQSRADFLSKMSIACKESREAHYWLRLFAATEISSSAQLAPLITEANELVAILTSIVKRTRGRNSE